jgi:raffinose/stachyose/melibiose transport system permease protein
LAAVETGSPSRLNPARRGSGIGGAKSARSARSRHQRRSAPWWFIIPGLAFYLFVIIVPGVQGAFYAFTSWDGLSSQKVFIGVKNFVQIFTDQLALQAIRQTLELTAAVTVGLVVFGLALALALRSLLKTRSILRVVFFAPVVIAPVMIAYLWQFILGPFGALNTVLTTLHLPQLELSWLGSPSVALWSVSAVIIWQYSGYAMVIFLAGLESIPPEVNEAALVDGATPFQRFRFVTFPLLSPAFVIVLTLAVIMGLKQFETVWIMTQGGPGNATQTLATLIYQEAFSLNDFGYGTALALVLSVLVMIVSGVLYSVSSRRNRLS